MKDPIQYNGTKTAVHCDTQEKAEEFIKLLHSKGFKWASGASLAKYTFWDYYRDETAYSFDDGHLKICYSPKNFYEDREYTVLPVEDFIEQNTTKNMENIIGYKLKEEYKGMLDAAKAITGTTVYSDYSWEENFTKEGYFFKLLSGNKDKLKAAGVLDLWFEPVHSKPEFKAGDLVIVLDTKNVRSYTSNAIGHILKLSESNIRETEANRVFAEQGVQKYPVNYRKGDFRHATKEEIEEFNKPKVGDYIIFLKSFDSKLKGFITQITRISPDTYGKGWISYAEGGFRLEGDAFYLDKDFRKATKEEYDTYRKSKETILTLGTSNIRITIKGGKITADGQEFKLKSLKDTLGFFSSYNSVAYPGYEVRFKGSFRIGCSDFTKEDLELIIKTAESQLGKNETTTKHVEDYPF